jgi:hypothetical protein
MSTTTDDNQTLPNRFTGKHRGAYYYKGHRWVGPTNLIGYVTHPQTRWHEAKVPVAGYVRIAGSSGPMVYVPSAGGEPAGVRARTGA